MKRPPAPATDAQHLADLRGHLEAMAHQCAELQAAAARLSLELTGSPPPAELLLTEGRIPGPAAATCGILCAMTIRVTVTVRCDAAQTPDCHREYSTEGHDVPATVFCGAKAAQDAGWRKDWMPVGLADL